MSDQRKKQEYYPYIEKAEEFDLGYVSKKSGHTRGSTVDLTIAKIGSKIEDRKWVSRKLEDGREILFLDDGIFFNLKNQRKSGSYKRNLKFRLRLLFDIPRVSTLHSTPSAICEIT